MPSPFKSVQENAREEVLASDLNRLQKLASKALQDEMGFAAMDSSELLVSYFTRQPDISGVAATFNVDLGLGEAMTYDVTGVGADDSNYQVMQWGSQTVGPFATPDPVNPRIDLIVVTPATLASDVESRNVLVDPVARTVVPQNVPKTVSPTATIAILTGTAAATPLPPTPTGEQVAMFEVRVPALAADSTAFVFYPRLFRKTSYPFISGLQEAPQCGILRGCRPVFTTTFAAISGPSGPMEHAVVIDGEIIHFGAVSSLGNNDVLANPFSGAAPGGNDVPFFLYVIGGRGNPQGAGVGVPATQFGGSVALVASTTAPDVLTGRPSSPIQGVRGVATQNAVYIGIGFKKKGTTNYQIVRHVGDRVWFYGTGVADPYFEQVTTPHGGTTATTLASAPSISDEVIVQPEASGLDVSTNHGISPHGFTTGFAAWAITNPQSNMLMGQAISPMIPGAGPHIDIGVAGTAGNLISSIVAYSMKVRRLG